MRDKSLLRNKLEAARVPLKRLTVLAAQHDPFRLDTPAGHRDGKWLADTAAGLGLGDRKIHLRGLHYMVIGEPKPDGTSYTNTDNDWTWLQESAGKAARWLGYIGFDQISDQRNSEPVVIEFAETAPDGWLGVDHVVTLRTSPRRSRPTTSSAPSPTSLSW